MSTHKVSIYWAEGDQGQYWKEDTFSVGNILVKRQMEKSENQTIGHIFLRFRIQGFDIIKAKRMHWRTSKMGLSGFWFCSFSNDFKTKNGMH